MVAGRGLVSSSRACPGPHQTTHRGTGRPEEGDGGANGMPMARISTSVMAVWACSLDEELGPSTQDIGLMHTGTDFPLLKRIKKSSASSDGQADMATAYAERRQSWLALVGDGAGGGWGVWLRGRDPSGQVRHVRGVSV